jgi:hypothetical protein
MSQQVKERLTSQANNQARSEIYAVIDESKERINHTESTAWWFLGGFRVYTRIQWDLVAF